MEVAVVVMVLAVLGIVLDRKAYGPAAAAA